MRKKILKLRAIQDDFWVGAIEENTQKILTSISAAKKDGVQLVCFPEMSLTGYPPEDLLFRETLYKRCEQALKKIIPACNNITALVGLPRQVGMTCYNSVAVIQAGKLLGFYDKQALPNYGVFDEKRYFTPGQKPFIFSIDRHRFAPLICEDAWQRTPGESAKAAGADAIITLNASPFRRDKMAERIKIIATRARETGLPWVYLNLVGGQDELVFDGGSFVVDATGNITQSAPYFEPATCEITLISQHKLLTPETRQIAAPKNPTNLLYRALTTGTRDYLKKTGFQKAVLGLSGGIDSALVAAIAVDALGPENVTAVLMPSPYTATMSQEDALTIAQSLGISTYILPIDAVFNTFLNTLAPVFNGTAVDHTEENIQARIRGTLLMAYSNKIGAMVLTTGNRSELAVGYTTLYGDMAGGFNPLKNISKTQVYTLSRYRNARNPVIPERVLTRAPSAELAPNQTDQDHLPPYDVLDQILEHHIDGDEDATAIIARGFESEQVKDILARVRGNEYKRHQAPPGVRISRRSFGKDRRYPISGR